MHFITKVLAIVRISTVFQNSVTFEILIKMHNTDAPERKQIFTANSIIHAFHIYKYVI